MLQPELVLLENVHSLVLAHSLMLMPTSRSVEAEKVGPCGGLPPSSQPLVLSVGQELRVEWEEYIDHPGYYQILFSFADDEEFFMLRDHIEDVPLSGGETSNFYSTTVTLPSTPCENGTLQLIQVMTENPEQPRLYFACTDIRLVEEPAPEPKRRSKRGRALRLFVIVAIAVCVFNVLKNRGSSETEL